MGDRFCSSAVCAGAVELYMISGNGVPTKDHSIREMIIRSLAEMIDPACVGVTSFFIHKKIRLPTCCALIESIKKSGPVAQVDRASAF